MDEQDCQILDALQNNFPLSERPYDIIAQKLQIPSDELWDRTQKLINEGVVRRIGVSLDSRKLGFCSTLAAVNCQADVIEQAAQIIGQFSEVTHSYLRNDNFNIWFTLIAVDEERIECILEQIRTSLSLKPSQVLNLPMKHLFKLNARFKVVN
ncbi:MAG: AsnC family transcriptional regulator [Sedimentisphaerales bacterium]|nr:AsnC family transcriptional regulator [Sedimentisphaerales bacterium]